MTTYLEQLKNEARSLEADITSASSTLDDIYKNWNSNANNKSYLEDVLRSFKNLPKSKYSDELKTIFDRITEVKNEVEKESSDFKDQYVNFREKNVSPLKDKHALISLTLKLMTNFNISSDIINLFNHIKNNEPLNGKILIRNWISSPSNYKRDTLINADEKAFDINYFFHVREQGSVRKLQQAYEVGIKDSTVFILILDFRTSMRKKYTIKDGEDNATLELHLFDKNTQAFNKVATLPPISKDKILEAVYSEL